MARRLQMPSGQSGAVITDVDPDSGSATAGVRPGDVILSVNRRPVASAADAGRELQKIPSGGLAQLLLWRDEPGQVFVPVKKGLGTGDCGLKIADCRLHCRFDP